MIKAFVTVAVLYAVFLLSGLLAAPLLGLPQRAAPDFPGNAQYKLQPSYGMSGEEIFAQVSPDRLKQRVVLIVQNGVMRAVTVEEQQRELEELSQGKPITPKGEVVNMMSQWAAFKGEVTTARASVQHAFDLNFAVRNHVINVETPQACEPLEFRHWSLTLLGVGPSRVVFCPAADKNARAPAIISFYAVDGWLITQMYTQLTCSLIHDELSARLGAKVDGREHICFGFREDSLPALWRRNPLSVRHHIFSSR